MGSVAEWSKALDLSTLLDSQWGKPARVRTSPLPGIFLYFVLDPIHMLLLFPRRVSAPVV